MLNGATTISWNVPFALKLTVSLCVQRFFSLFFYGCSFLFLSQICHTYQSSKLKKKIYSTLLLTAMQNQLIKKKTKKGDTYT
jgi:hypothetical protein